MGVRRERASESKGSDATVSYSAGRKAPADFRGSVLITRRRFLRNRWLGGVRGIAACSFLRRNRG